MTQDRNGKWRAQENRRFRRARSMAQADWHCYGTALRMVAREPDGGEVYSEIKAERDQRFGGCTEGPNPALW